MLAVELSQVLTALFLGLLVGALMAEDALLIPYWRTLTPKEFYALHPVYAPRLFKFFAPLTIAGPSLSLFAAIASFVFAAPGHWFSIASAAFAWSLVGIYFIYFKDANAAFSRAAIAEAELATELGHWATWHRRRCWLGFVGFVLSLLALFRL
jgi:hypothetical protein